MILLLRRSLDYGCSTLSIDQSNCSPGFLNFQLTENCQLTLKMASARAVEMSVANNSPSQKSYRTSVCEVVQGSKS